MFKEIKKIGSLVLGLSVIGIVSVGLNSSFTQQASHADLPAPQNPDLSYNKGDTWSPQRPDLAYSDGHTGGIVAQEGHADFPAPAYNKGDTPLQQA
ncbi:Phr family secreted Rap phosphatase inhibitor [Bacillus sp. BP-3]|uniref:Phr family secreted Rap phosphatase inhibitor n=1 Tax=Bacillus sp. BP-3 TaxID=3022773 RepID=UPI00232B3D18|nr:Phr family secreted Rap phosphatase inhibitor [Bacillus sp. BP-3]MDC2867715.1 Phr family secreted Rap phosphatase inhibitor [Bacillus sp. BP-3]